MSKEALSKKSSRPASASSLQRQVVAEYRNGKTTDYICHKFGITRPRLSVLLRSAGIFRQRPKYALVDSIVGPGISHRQSVELAVREYRRRKIQDAGLPTAMQQRKAQQRRRSGNA